MPPNRGTRGAGRLRAFSLLRGPSLIPERPGGRMRLLTRGRSAMRLVTRGDLDGLTCAVIITSSEEIDEILLVHPQDVTDKRLAITQDDILANLPYQSGSGKRFDHHLLTESTERPPEKFE